MFNGTLANSAGVKRLTIGITGRDGKLAEMKFEAPNTAAPLVAIDETPALPEPTPADLAEMSAHFANDETPLGEMFGGE